MNILMEIFVRYGIVGILVVGVVILYLIGKVTKTIIKVAIAIGVLYYLYIIFQPQVNMVFEWVMGFVNSMV